MTELIYLMKILKAYHKIYIAHETITRKKTYNIKKAYNRFKSSNSNSHHFGSFQYSFRLLNKFLDLSASPKGYWSVFKSSQNNKKVPCILIIFNDNRFTTNFKEKAELFTASFAKPSSNVE